jgi:predicted MPP superfamily phosphohydrolase
VLVSHTPWDIEIVAKEGVGLMLASHTHDGQIWPFGYLVRLTHPFLSGRYEVNAMTVIVCRGTGTWGPRMRLWRRGEIVRITLRASQNG